MSGTATAIQVETGFFPLSFFLFFCHPRVVIDEETHQETWGTHSFPISSGSHSVKVFFKYFTMEECGANTIEVNVAEGETKRVKYSAPLLMTMKGTIKEVA